MRSQGVANTPYQAYTGQLTAPVNAQQQMGIGNINSNAGFATPYIQQAAGMTTGASNPLTAEQIQNYQNPYTQSVVDATQAQFAKQNAVQQAQVKGNSIARGALGGNRLGVAQGAMAGQQAAAQAPVIAGLYNQSYQNALQTANQQYQQNPLAAGYQLGNLGVAGQTAALSGAGAQLGAGNLMQQTQQAEDTARYQQYMQQQAYPFQTTQWLAGLQSGVGSQLGSTSTSAGQGTSTPPPPNPWNQALGLGMTAASMFLSDERAKEDIHKIGETNDGQPIYRYKYKGSPEWQIGLIAQDVEDSHPDAVHAGVDNMKYVDLKAATDDSVEGRAHGGGVQNFARGGGEAAGFGAMPWGGVQSWVPQMDVRATPLQAPNPGSTAAPGGGGGVGNDMKMAEQGMGNLAKAWRNRDPGPVDLSASGIEGFAPSSVGTSFTGGSGAWNPLGGMYADGGPVISDGGVDYPPPQRPGFAPGGAPEWDMMNGDPSWQNPDVGEGYFVRPALPRARDIDHINGDPSWQNPDVGTGYPAPAPAPAGVAAPLSFADRIGPAQAAIDSGAFDPQGANSTTMAPTPAMADAAAGVIPTPRARPAAAPQAPAEDDDDVAPPLPTTAIASRGVAPVGLGAVADTDMSAQQRAPAPAEKNILGFDRLSDAAQTGLMTAGLGMMASRSPYLGTGIGEGGLAGVQAYQGVKAAEAKAATEAKNYSLQAKRLSQDADRIAQDIKLRTSGQAETSRHNRATEKTAQETRSKFVPAGSSIAEDGTVRPLVLDQATGKVVDAVTGQAPDPKSRILQKGEKPAAAASMDDATAELLADRVRAGDNRALIGLGRGAQGAENLAKIQGIVARKAKEGAPISPEARSILANAANHVGFVAAERTQANIMAKLSVYGRTAFNATDIAERLSDAVPRTEFMPVNKVLNAYKTNTGDPKIVALGQALMTLTNEYARAIGGGHGTVHDKEAAEKRLSAAQTPEQLRAVLDVMRQEITAEERAMPEAREHIRDIYNPDGKGHKRSVSDRTGAKGSPAAERVIQNGYIYEKGPDGKMNAVGRAP